MLNFVQKDFGDSGVEKRRQGAALTDSRLEGKARNRATAVPDRTERAVIQRTYDVHGACRQTNVGESGHEELLGDGWEGAGEVQEDACAIFFLKGSDHTSSLDVQEVGQDGTSRQKALLVREDPFG